MTDLGGIGASIMNICNSIYGTLSGFITPLAIVCFAICLVGMLVSNNQKTVETFKAWRNRILIAWVIFMSLGTLSNVMEDVIEAGGLDQYSGSGGE